jgi:hypothetical protein
MPAALICWSVEERDWMQIKTVGGSSDSEVAELTVTP